MSLPAKLESSRAWIWLLGTFLFLGTLTLLLLLGQETFYKIDGQGQILRVVRGSEPHPHHLLQDPLLDAYATLLEWTGLRFFVIARSLSSLGMAVAVLLSFLTALRLGLTKEKAFLAALLVGSAPGVLFHGTIIEFHGTFLPFAALAILAGIQAGMRPGVLPILLAGCTYALANLIHSTATLLLPFVVLFGLLLERERTGRWALIRWLSFLLLALVVSGLFVKAILLIGLIPPAPENPLRDQALQQVGPVLGRVPGLDWVMHEASRLQWSDLAFLPHSVLREWILPCAASSILFVLLLGNRTARPRALTLLLALVPYLALSFILLTRYDEFGAYALPMLIPAAIFTAGAVPRLLILSSLPIALAFGIQNVYQHDTRPSADKVEVILNAEAQLGSFTLLCDNQASGWFWPALIAQKQPHCWTLQELGLPLYRDKDIPSVLQRIEGLVASEADRGRILLLSRGALQLLEDSSRLPIGPGLLEALRTQGKIEDLVGEDLQKLGVQIR